MTTDTVTFEPRHDQLMALPKHRLVQMYLDKRDKERYARSKWRYYSNKYVALRDRVQAAGSLGTKGGSDASS